MHVTRLCLYISALVAALVLGAYLFALVANAQTTVAERDLRPDMRRALTSRRRDSAAPARKGGYIPLKSRSDLEARTRAAPDPTGHRARPTARAAPRRTSVNPLAALTKPIRAGTTLSRVLHTSQLSLTTAAGTNEQLADQTGDLIADERTRFDARGGSFDITVGRSGARYEVYSAIDDRGTSNTSDDVPVGALVAALDTNGDYVRDSSSTFDLERDFRLPSAVAVVSGISKAGREFVVVSSSGYFNSTDPNDPDNEPSAGVVLLVRDSATGGFDGLRSRELIRVGSNQLNNANALALLPGNDLLIADFDSNELRVVRDTDNDGVPDTLDPTPYFSYRFSDDAPLDIAANSRGVVFSHSFGNDAVLLALDDTNGDGRADLAEVVVEGLSLDNNLILHGLSVDRVGSVYVIEDAAGAADTKESGGNGGPPRVSAFPDPSLNGFLSDGVIYTAADNPDSQALSGLSFGIDPLLAAVNRLTLVNSASLRGPATFDGLASVLGTGLTLGARGASASEASARGVRVSVEGRSVPVLSFSDTQINIYIPGITSPGIRSVVVSINGLTTAADDASVAPANPGVFTRSQNGAGEAIALLVSGNRYTSSPFPARMDGQPSIIALFGTGWRHSLPVTVNIGGSSAAVQYAGPAGGFPGLDQINVAIPDGVSDGAVVTVTAANGFQSRGDVMVSLR